MAPIAQECPLDWATHDSEIRDFERQYKYRFECLKNVNDEEWATDEAPRVQPAVGGPTTGQIGSSFHLSAEGFSSMILDFEAGMEMETGLDTTNVNIESRFGFNIAEYRSWQEIDYLQPSPMQGAMMQSKSPRIIAGSPRPQSATACLSPFSQFLDLEQLGMQPDFILTFNLPWFKFQSFLDIQVNISHLTPTLGHGPLSPRRASSHLLLNVRTGGLSTLLGSMAKVDLDDDTEKAASHLQQLMPERDKGEISTKLRHILEPSSSILVGLSSLFTLAAFSASNNSLDNIRLDNFVKWSHECQATAEFFDLGFMFDSVLEDIAAWVGDTELLGLLLTRVDPNYFKSEKGSRLFLELILRKQLDLACNLMDRGVSVNGDPNEPSVLWAAVDELNIEAVLFLLQHNARVDIVGSCRVSGGRWCPCTPLGRAIWWRNSELVSILLENGADINYQCCKADGQNVLEWSSLHCRKIYNILKKTLGDDALGMTTGDLVEAADIGAHTLKSYITKRPGKVSSHQMEKALNASIIWHRLSAAVVLLDHGAGPDCPTLPPKSRPLHTALTRANAKFVEILIRFGADVNLPLILDTACNNDDHRPLQLLLDAGVSLEEHGMSALAKAASLSQFCSASILLNAGVDINTPGLPRTPLQEVAAAVANGKYSLDMVRFLLAKGGDVNAPAHPYGGRTALQAALEGHLRPVKISKLLLDRGADGNASPILLCGCTALEALVNHDSKDGTEALQLCHQLLDAGAAVNRPHAEPSSSIHGVISQGWTNILGRMLEPQYNEEEDDYMWDPRTPTQLAAEHGNLEAIEMLLSHGVDANEAPGMRYGRTALQASTSRPSSASYMDLIDFLLEKGANINAEPGIHGAAEPKSAAR
ncbi:ankyrin repeat-containing domain protein [Apodospora peruviana]|uniref:Ankyrin repeat-containing domain protein n=1 Tax=Apodospora peruviana TaxID=516989 RepID=A0AAE0HT58_9PEZI|nr:ankyrin repeat-containing domain protein [Apodospora peruviana]